VVAVVQEAALMFLTHDEIVDLTGLKRPGDQHRFLRENGWPVERDARGRPRLLRSVVESRMGAVALSQQSAPNWEALRGT
jgi:hypothetical protein